MKNMFDLPDFELKNMDGEQEGLFSDARQNIVFGSQIYAYLITQCEYLVTSDIEHITASAVHGTRNVVYINPEMFFDPKLNRKQRAAAIVHSIDHIMLMHRKRGLDGAYEDELWNLACDYYCNNAISGAYLDENGNKKFSERYQRFFELPNKEDYPTDDRFLDKSAEEIYHILKKEQKGGGGGKQQQQQQGGSQSQGQGGGQGDQQGQGGGQGGQGDQGDQQGQGGGQGGQQKKKKGGDMLGGDGGQDPNQGQGGNQGDMFGDGGSAAGERQNMQSLQAAVVSAQQNNGIGCNEGNIARIVEEMAKPKIDWTDKVYAAMRSTERVETTYTRLSRRSYIDPETGEGVVFPTYFSRKLRIVFGADSSGSMGRDDFMRAKAELAGVLRFFDSWDLYFVTCDMKLHYGGYYSTENSEEFEDVDVTFNGGGGTDMSPIARFAAEKHAEEPIDVCLIISDGYIDADVVDQAWPEGMVNLFLSTRVRDIEMRNADVIYVGE